MKYYLAGYYLVKLKPIDFGTMVGKEVYTCSECLNDNLINIWAYPWTTDNNAAAKDAKINFNLTDDHISAIRNYVDKKNNENRIGWINVFSELEDAREFKNKFFSHLHDIKIIALYFNENETKDILEEFKPEQDTFGEIGLRVTLLTN